MAQCLQYNSQAKCLKTLAKGSFQIEHAHNQASYKSSIENLNNQLKEIKTELTKKAPILKKIVNKKMQDDLLHFIRQAMNKGSTNLKNKEMKFTRF